jgi:hypothetical protein
MDPQYLVDITFFSNVQTQAGLTDTDHMLTPLWLHSCLQHNSCKLSHRFFPKVDLSTWGWPSSATSFAFVCLSKFHCHKVRIWKPGRVIIKFYCSGFIETFKSTYLETHDTLDYHNSCEWKKASQSIILCVHFPYFLSLSSKLHTFNVSS